MSVSSVEFIFLLLVCGAIFFHLPGRGLKLLGLSAANAFALALLLPNWQSAVALAVFLLSGYVVARVLQRFPSMLLLSGYLLALVAAFLVLKKYDVVQWALPMSLVKHPIGIIGLSYMLFRQIHFIVDAMQEQIEGGTLCAYLNYQLNLFGILSGPIQRFQDFHEFWQNPQPLIADRHELLKAILRINWGVLKLAAIGGVCFYVYELSLSTLDQINRGFLVQFSLPRRLFYFAVMFYSFPAYLYFNFSGYCDIVIGGARLFGIRMPENFDQPYLARNMIDYWNRFHRTLSHWIRDYLFMPLYKGAVERTPTLAEPLSIVFMFVALFLAGVWHGSTLNWVVFGALNGIGVGAVKLWELAILRARGRQGHKAYLKSPKIRLAAIVVNLNFACLTYLFFPVDMAKTLRAINAVITGA
ncbi:MAG TPA: MBOAT family O-acyltransferase [Pirellulales bacterium]